MDLAIKSRQTSFCNLYHNKRMCIFFVGYQEGDVIPKTFNFHTTILTKVLKLNDMAYEEFKEKMARYIYVIRK